MSQLRAPKLDLPSIAGYHDLELVGEGATSRVFRAVEAASGSVVAVKLLHSHLAAEPLSVERFRREIQITRSVSHPQMVAAHDIVESEDGLALIMEYVEGTTLKEHIHQVAPLGIQPTTHFVRQLLTVLEVCHARGIVHRDLKPQNVMVQSSGDIKLVDFGIARMASVKDLTRTGATLGSPEYMAPELFSASDFDPRADLYAVGVTAFEMLTGRLPYHADSVALLFHAHRHEPIPSASIEGNEVPSWLDAFVRRLLAKNPFDRYQTAREALTDLSGERVPSSEMPSFPKRECLSCGEQTLKELLICAFCGYHELETFLPGRYDVRVSPDRDPEKLSAFLKAFSVAGRTDTDTRKRTMLAYGIDRISAELLKERARRYGLYASAEKRAAFSLLNPVLSLYGLGAAATLLAVSPFVGWLLAPRALNLPYPGDAAFAGVAVIVGLLLVSAARLAVCLYRGEWERPLLGAWKAVSGKLDAEYAWMNDLVPLLAKLRSAEMRQVSARLVEKQYLLRQLAARTPLEVSRRIEAILAKAVELAGLISEIDEALEQVRFADWEHEAIAAKAREQHEKALELEAQLDSLLTLLDRRGTLVRHLSETTYLFNRLAGDALVSSTDPLNVSAESLDDTRRALERHITASREVRAELEALT